MAVLFAFGFAVSAMVSALAVDAASLYHERRVLQAGVDLAAISAAADPSRATEIAQSVLAEARLLAPASTDGLTVLPGRYDPTEPDIADRFTPGQKPHNAVSVTLNRPGRLYFAASFAAVPTLQASGIAAVTPEVSFSVGSRLASLNNGLANAILSGLLGTTLSLSVLDYTALAAARIDALDFLDALATELGVTAGSYDDLLATRAGAGDIAAALAALTNGTAQSALMLLSTAGTGADVELGKLIDLGRLGGLDLGSAGAADLSVSVLELLSAAAVLSDGDNQVSLNLGAAVPGLVSLQLDLAIGEPPQGGGWFTLGPLGTIVRTAQTRLRLRAELLGGPALLGAGVKLPLWLDLAPAEARAEAATCPTIGAPDRYPAAARHRRSHSRTGPDQPGRARFFLSRHCRGHHADSAHRNAGGVPRRFPVGWARSHRQRAGAGPVTAPPHRPDGAQPARAAGAPARQHAQRHALRPGSGPGRSRCARLWRALRSLCASGVKSPEDPRRRKISQFHCPHFPTPPCPV